MGYSSEGEVVFDSPGLVQDPAALVALRAALGDPDPRVRAAVAWLLPVFKGDAAASVPLLTARLKDPDVKVRRAAGEALSRFGPAAKDATPTLLEALSDPDENYINDDNVSAKAAKALEAIGPAAKAAMIDRLTGRLGDPDEPVRRRASWAFQMLRGKVASPLFRLLADPKTPRTSQGRDPGRPRGGPRGWRDHEVRRGRTSRPPRPATRSSPCASSPAMRMRRSAPMPARSWSSSSPVARPRPGRCSRPSAPGT